MSDNAKEVLLVLIIMLSLFLLFFSFATAPLLEDYFTKREEICVSFYKDNGYVLDKCSKYTEKLEALEIETQGH